MSNNMGNEVKSDLEIARAATLAEITDITGSLDIPDDAV